MQGKGVMIFNDSKYDNQITFATYKNDNHVEGNFITIFESGEIQVGQIYFKDGKKKRVGTGYKKDGASFNFDQDW